MQKLIAAIAVLALALSGYSLYAQHPKAGGQLYNFDNPNFANGLTAGLSKNFSVDKKGNLTASSTNLTTTNGTSTLAVGCITAHATSSATAIKLFPIASSTQTAPGYDGLVYWKYGSCP